jgi:hypothetical protein
MYVFFSIAVICLTLIIISYINRNNTNDSLIIKKHKLTNEESKSLGYDYVELHQLTDKQIKSVYWNHESPVDNI